MHPFRDRSRTEKLEFAQITTWVILAAAGIGWYIGEWIHGF